MSGPSASQMSVENLDQMSEIATKQLVVEQSEVKFDLLNLPPE
jgi:hypothetical protein